MRVINNAFGGLRNRITYEVNLKYTEHGDEIKGSFYLVTNGGEREIPYSLRVRFQSADENLEKLKTARDFAALARRDLELALRMFEYQDFTEAPFMQDARVRTIYEGLRGRTGRRNLLEEFLVALRVKEAVTLFTDCREPRVYRERDELTGAIDIAASGWGYVSVTLQADMPFLALERQTITDRDFSGGHCRVSYRILPEYLHRGRNFGRIRIASQRQEFFLTVEVWGSPKGGAAQGKAGEPEQMDKASLYRYFSLRLDYETGVYEPALLINQMMKETERLRTEYPQDERIKLLQAELLILNGREENASLLLEEVKNEIFRHRQEQVESYCFYEYLYLLIHPSDSQKESLVRYVKKLLWEAGEQKPYLFLMLIKLDGTLLQNPLELYRSLENIYKNGGHSPFIYAAACHLVESHPDLLDKLGDFEVQLLYLGIRRGMVSRQTALKAARLMMEVRHYRKLTEHLALRLYEAYPEMELLAALCSLLIKGERKGPDAFKWYEKALKCQINLTRLYEYFLYSLPADYGCLLPKEVLLYFSYDKDLDSHSRSVLYSNILMYMNPSSELYQTYTRYMEQFAMDQLFRYKIDSSLAVIYEHMIYKDMIDSRVAKVLPGILKSCRVQCDDARMKYVIVRYEELDQEKAYLLENQAAYVPIFSKHIVLLFQDAYGSRYLDVKHRRIPVMDKPELLAQCYKVYPEHPMLKLGECCRILEHGVETQEDAALLENVMAQMDLNPVFERRILKAVTDYYCKKASGEKAGTGAFNCTYLLQIDKASLGERERQQICETLIGQNYMQEAYDMVREYGSQYISEERLMQLSARMILMQLFDQDELLLLLAYGSFRAGKFDSVILDYLCEHFNGTVSQMYEVLIQGVKERVETYDLEERLLCQMMFTGCCDQIDSVFDLYMKRKNTTESVVKAYFTEKSIQYFLGDEKVDERVFTYLKKAVSSVSDVGKMPSIYLLALTRYFSTLEELEEEDRSLCRKMTALLLEEGLVFPYTRDLSRHIPVSEDILDKAMVEYRGSRDGCPELQVRILPQEQEFHREDFPRVYQGIYVKEKILFEGEIMEYRIFDHVDGEWRLVKEGQACCDHKLEGRENSRFACLNRMGAAIEERDDVKLSQAMEDYLKKSAALGLLFPIEDSEDSAK